MSSKGSENMKIPHRKRDYSIPIMLAVAVLISVFCFASRSFGVSNFLTNGLSVTVTPLQSATKSIYDFFESVGTYFEGVESLKKENDRLTLENKQLKEENETIDRLTKENESLSKFLGIKKEHSDFEFIDGDVISRNTGGYSIFFTINKGSSHGIKPGMPVISDEGTLVGITHSVDVTSTRCKSILSYDMNEGIYNERTGETAILSGSYDTFSQNKCVIKNLPQETTFKKGDKILTSGYGEIYPRGLKIGSVEGFAPDAGTHSNKAIVKIEHASVFCDKVMVISSFKNIYE